MMRSTRSIGGGGSPSIATRVSVVLVAAVAIGCGQGQVDQSREVERRLVEPISTGFPSNQLAAISSGATYSAKCTRESGTDTEYVCRIMQDPSGISGNPEAEGETRWLFSNGELARLSPGGDSGSPPDGSNAAARVVDEACESRSGSSPQSMATAYEDGSYCHTECEPSQGANAYLCALAFEGSDPYSQAVGYQEWKWNEDGTVAHEYNRGDLAKVAPRREYDY